MTGFSLQRLGSRVRWQIAMAWECSGPVELVTLALLLLWLGLQALVVRPLSDLVAAEGAQLAALQQTVGAIPMVAAPRGTRLMELPAGDLREAQLLDMHRLAERQGLQIERIGFRSERMKDMPVQRLSLQVDISGPFIAQRQLLHDWLAALPNLAIDALRIERVGAIGDEVVLHLDASLYFQGETAR